MQKNEKEGVRRGTVKAVPCPWCAQICKDLDALGDALVQNAVFECDFCNNLFEITALFEVRHVVVERHGEMLHKGHLRG